MQPLVRASEVAKLLAVRPGTVYELARRGLLPHVRLREDSKRPLVRFRIEDIERLIRERTISALEPK